MRTLHSISGFLLMLFLLIPSVVYPCVDLFSSKGLIHHQVSETRELRAEDRYLLYLKEITRDFTSHQEVVTKVIESLNRGMVPNPMEFFKPASTPMAFQLHQQVFEIIKADLSLNRSNLRDSLLRALDGGKARVLLEAKHYDSTKYIEVPIELFSLPKRGVKSVFASSSAKEVIYLEYGLEVMSDLVTQLDFVKLMGYNPSVHRQPIVSGSGAQTFGAQMLRPVENISFYEAVIFANRLSEMRGLKPAYIIDGPVPTINELARGFKLPANSIRLNTESGKLAELEGYRLPSVVEQSYLLSHAIEAAILMEQKIGNRIGDYTALKHFNRQHERSSFHQKYGWMNENSSGFTQPVRTRDGIVIDGHLIFDVIGNVFEMPDLINRREGVDPLFINKLRYDLESNYTITNTGWSVKEGNPEKSGHFGFRLVRTLK